MPRRSPRSRRAHRHVGDFRVSRQQRAHHLAIRAPDAGDRQREQQQRDADQITDAMATESTPSK
jgi:hypothetical protein